MSQSFPIKINVPQYIITVPSTKEKVSMRPFLVGEQKSMMLALATEDTYTIVNAIKMLLDVCSSGQLKVSSLTSFDIEYLFLQLRAKSVGEHVILAVDCGNCEESISFKVDISQSEVDFSTSVPEKIQLTQDIGVKMRFPTLEENINLNDTKNNPDILVDTVVKCITHVWNASDYISTSDYSIEQTKSFVDSLTVPQMEQLTNFILLMPSVKIMKDVECPHCQHKNRVLIEGLENFFD